jgi:hypothetical protein
MNQTAAHNFVVAAAVLQNLVTSRPQDVPFLGDDDILTAGPLIGIMHQSNFH